ncbi:MAG: hypothetical protein P1V35_08500 [Planctomycetota bacterium]|nr:hypothetical protein [Planctomycetota bacterium]
MKHLVSTVLIATLGLPLTGCLSFSSPPDQGPYRSRVEALESADYESDPHYQHSETRPRPRRPKRRVSRKDDYYPKELETFHLTVGVGQMRDDAYWQGLDEPWFLGMDYAAATDGDGLGAEVGFLLWGDSTSPDQDLSAAELFAGLRYTANANRRGPHPYVGIGGTLIGAKLEGPAYDENDGAIGIYGHAGVTVPLGSSTEIGLDYRVVRGTEADFPGGPDSDFDYDRLALVIGWSF